MDGLAPSPRRSDRPMVSQNPGPGNDGRRRRPGGFGPLEPTDDGNLSLGRRIGVLVVLAALGGAIILAAGGVGNDKPPPPLVSPSAHTTTVGPTPRPTPSPPTVAPRIRPPKVRLITDRAPTIRVTVPETGTSMSGMELRIYRNSTLLASPRVTAVGLLKVTNVPLRRGSNKLTATLANAGGEGPRSAIVTITVDDQPPKVNVKSPRTNTTLNESHVTIAGRTEDGLAVTGRNITSDHKVTVDADASGAYSLELGLTAGRNIISISSRDAAGNRGSTTMVVIRGDGHLAANLELSRRKYRLKTLPRTMNARVTVLDADGQPVDGATVVFSISPPGQLAYNHPTTTGSDGTARWSSIPLPKSKATTGDGLMAVEVTTPDGSSTTSTVHFQYK